MLTVFSEKAKLIEAFGRGVDDFLSKPLHEGELFARLNAWSRMVLLQQQLAQRHVEALRANQELAHLNCKLAELAIQDELTGLPNRREAFRRLQEQWAIATRYDQPLCCAVIDVDHFKNINDTNGHRAGDDALKELSRRLTKALRESDGAFRVGGDEFLVLLPGIRLPEAMIWAERCRKSLSFDAVTVSIGVAERIAAMCNGRELMETADANLLLAKQSRNHVVARGRKNVA